MAPKICGNETAASNASDDEINRQPNNELEPTNPDNGEKSGFTLKRFVECGGIVGILMIWFEILDCHDLSKLIVASFALLFLYAGLCDFVHSFLKKKSWAVSLVLFIWIVLSLLTAAFVFNNDVPSPKRHLTLYAHTADSPDDILYFTNSFLFVKTTKDGFKFPSNLPFLAVEVARNEPQFALKFGVFNNSAPRFSPPEFDVEKPEINIWILNPDAGESLKWTADPKWEEVFTKGTTTNGAEIKFPGRVLRYQFPNSLSAGTGDSAPSITFNMQEKSGGLTVAVMVGGEKVVPVAYCFKLLAEPSVETDSKMRFDTNNVIWWKWKYRPVEYRPIDTPLIISPSRVQLSDGTNAFGTQITVSNPSSSNLYALTLSVEIESNAVPIGFPLIELSQPKKRETAGAGELQIQFEASMDFIGFTQSRLFVIPTLEANGQRSFWIRGRVLTNSFADISVWQSMNSFPDVKYTTNGTWMWPMLSSNSAWWIHSGGQPMDLDIGILAWRGIATNGFTNDSQIIPSRP